MQKTTLLSVSFYREPTPYLQKDRNKSVDISICLCVATFTFTFTFAKTQKQTQTIKQTTSMQQTQEQQHKYMEGNLGSLEEDNEDVCEPNMTLASLREEHMHEINWQYLSLNPHDNAVTLLLQHLDRLDWDWIAANPNDRVVDLWLQMFQDEMLRMDWKWLSLNSNDRIVDLLLAHPDKINKQQFSRNKNDRAVAFLLQQQPFWISWACLSSNENPQAVAEFIYTTSKEPTVPCNPPFFTLSFAEQTKEPTTILFSFIFFVFFFSAKTQKNPFLTWT